MEVGASICTSFGWPNNETRRLVLRPKPLLSGVDLAWKKAMYITIHLALFFTAF